MRTRSKAIFLAVLATTLVLATAASAAMVGIYRNGMETTAQRSQLVKLAGKECARGGSESALRITLGKATGECSYRTPVIGRDMEIAATERLLSGTPKQAQHGAYLGLVLRAGAGARFVMLVYPLQKKVQVVKYASEKPAEYLAIEKNVTAVKGLNEANALRFGLRETSQKGVAQVTASVNGTPVAEVADENGSSYIPGQFSGVVVGAAKSGNGLTASVDDVTVRVPVSF